MSSRVQQALSQLHSPASQQAPILHPSALHCLLEGKDAVALWVWRGSYLVYTLRVQFMVTKACPDLPAMAGDRKCTAFRGVTESEVSVFFHHCDIFSFTFSVNKSSDLERHCVRGYAQFGRGLLVVRLLDLVNSFMSW